jgi:hypothetical protein
MDKEVFFEKVHMYSKKQLVHYLWGHDYSQYFGNSLVESSDNSNLLTIVHNHTRVSKYLVVNDDGSFGLFDNLEDTISDLDIKTYFNDFESEDYEAVLSDLEENFND